MAKQEEDDFGEGFSLGIVITVIVVLVGFIVFGVSDHIGRYNKGVNNAVTNLQFEVYQLKMELLQHKLNEKLQDIERTEAQ